MLVFWTHLQKMAALKLLVVAVLVLIASTNGQNVNGNWGAWSAYGACSVTCGNGMYTRTRQCNNPAPSGTGSSCSGNDMETSACWATTCYPNILGNLDKNCGASNFGCVSGVVNCVDLSKRCDGSVDCSDGSDEDLTHAGCVTTCSGAGTMAISTILISAVVFMVKLLK